MKSRLHAVLILVLLMTACAHNTSDYHWYDKFVSTAVTLKSGGTVPLSDYLKFRDQALGGLGWKIRDELIKKGFTTQEIEKYTNSGDTLIVSVVSTEKN